MEILIYYLKKPVVKQIFVFAILGGIIYLMRELISLLLLTFIFIIIFNSLQNLLYRLLSKLFPVKKIFLTIFIYVVFLALLALMLRIYLPIIITQITALVMNITDYLTNLQSGTTDDSLFTKAILYVSTNQEFTKYLSESSTQLITYLKSIGTLGFYILMSIILSIFFMVEKKTITQFMRRFKKSKLSWMYDETANFFVKFTNSFGKVIQNQIIISFINCILTVITLIILGFPNIVGLGAMVFILGLVPVAGVFISLVPLTIIAYSTGGFMMVIYILVLVAVLHGLEGYILNPKLMSNTAKMPVFFTFIVLLVGEHFFGSWGLIVGLPLTMFLLDILDVLPDDQRLPQREKRFSLHR